MKEREIRLIYSEYSGSDSLPEGEKSLVKEALEAASGAYAPYSGFSVGAAILLEDGTVVKGANVENAAYPSGSCAEKTVISYAVSNYPNLRPLAIAVTAMISGTQTDEPVPPCGNCRQMLIEEEMRHGKPVMVVLAGKRKTYVLDDCASLMPLHFTRSNLKG